MINIKKILAVSALSFAMILPSAYCVTTSDQVATASAVVYICDQSVEQNAPEMLVQPHDKVENTEKKTDKDEKKKFNPVRSLLISLVISLIIAFVVVGSMKSKMKTVRKQSGAAGYTKNDSFKLEINKDTYLYNEISKTERPQSGS
jgi:hypothetical protein